MTKTGWKIDTFFVLAVFCFFSISVLMTLMFGGTVYKNIVEKSQEGYNERICLSYIWTKVKRGDEAGMVTTGDFCGQSALFIDEEFDGVRYRTVIYLYDGWVRELFSEEGLEFSPEDGTPVIEAETLAFEWLDNALQTTVNAEQLLVLPRCAIE